MYKPHLLQPLIHALGIARHVDAVIIGDLIKKETGKSAQEYIQLATMAKVKELLAETDKSISEIAYELGFNYPHHLSRVFKKVTGMTPSEYRALMPYT